MQDSLRRLVVNSESMTSQIAEQVEPRVLSAFGVSLTSRYGRAGELVQMLEFAAMAAERAVAHHVSTVDYDSSGVGASFRLHRDARPDAAAIAALRACAVATISRFMWLDGSHQGSDAH